MNSTMNSTTPLPSANATTTLAPPAYEDRVTVFSIYFLFAVSAIALHAIVAASIYRTIGPRKFHSFHVLTLNLYFTDTLTFVVYAFYACPCVILSYQIYGEVGLKVMGAFQTAGFIASIFLTFLISVNRAMAISQNKWNKKAFRKKNCYALGLLAWVLGGLAMLWNYEMSCFTIFDEKFFNFKSVCYLGQPVTTPSSIAVYVGAYGVGVFYVHAGYALYKRYVGVQLAQVQEAARGHRTRLLLQAFFIWLSLLANVLATRIVNYLMPSGVWGMWAVIVTVLVVFWSRSVPPICMLIFAPDIRSGAKGVLGCNVTAIVSPLQNAAFTGSAATHTMHAVKHM